MRRGARAAVKRLPAGRPTGRPPGEKGGSAGRAAAGSAGGEALARGSGDAGLGGGFAGPAFLSAASLVWALSGAP